MQKRDVRIIGVPMDLGAGHRGVGMGPSAVRVAGLRRRVEALGHRVQDAGDVEAPVADAVEVGADERSRYFESVLRVNQALAALVTQTLHAGQFPLVIGGDHSVAIGTVAAAGASLAERGESLGLIWLDAHADMNTPQTSPTGNIHGMSLAVALGHGRPEFVNLVRPGRKVRPQQVALVGVRDLDPPERDALRAEGVGVYTMRDIDERGMFAVMGEAIERVTQGTAGVYVQFDMDVVDPDVAPGTGTRVRGGLSYREAHLAMEMLADTDRVIGLDLVETNPALDVCNKTAELATELALSLLGKRIFRRPSSEWAEGAEAKRGD